MSITRRPFQNMTPTMWRNLALAAILIAYLAEMGLDVAWGNICGHLGADYCAFWSAGHIANNFGYREIYNLDLLSQIQKSNFPTFGDPSFFAVAPIAYLPVFILPFQLLAYLSPAQGFFIWAFLNIAVLIYYLRYFIAKTTQNKLATRLLLMMVLSLPVYWNLLNGQVNLWLMICVGEFFRASIDNKPFRAGLWLAGLLLKPQLLIFIIPALLLQRSYKTISAWMASSALLGGISILLIGASGWENLFRVWLGFSKGMATNDVEVMMNWRMLGTHLAILLSQNVGWTIAGIGILFTIGAVFYLWRKRIPLQSLSYSKAMLGTLAATCLVAWHSHIHTAMILIPVLIFLNYCENSLPKNLVEWWVFLPTSIYFVSTILASFAGIPANDMPTVLRYPLYFARGFSEMGFNFYILVWTIKQL